MNPAAPAPGPPDARPGGLRGLVRDLLALDRRALAVLLTVPIVLTLLDYYGMPWQHGARRELRPTHAGHSLRTPPPLAEEVATIEVPGPRPVRRYLWWSASCLLLLVLVPLLVMWIVARVGPRDLGFRLRGTARDAWIYAVLFVLFFPVVYLFSRTPEFTATYPFFRPAAQGLGPEFWTFEAAYFAQFLAIEFFFRGVIVLGLRPLIGPISILVMLAPYCMIHYYKPLPEALGSIGAGLVLGTLSYRTGTILYGWWLHFAVALSMDLLALHHLGRL